MKKIGVLLLSGILGLSMAGCSSSALKEPATTAAESKAEATEATTAAGAETPAASEAGGKYEQVTIRLAHTSQESDTDPYHYAALQIKSMLEERSGGAVTVEIYPNSQYGNEREMFEGVMMGTVDMAIMTAANISEFAPAFRAVDLPFIFPSSEAAWAALDGPAGTAIGETLKDVGVKGLAWGETGFRQMVTNGHGIKATADFNGMKVRSVENEIYVKAYSAWGANPSPLSWSETLTAFQQGAIDGFDVPISIVYGSSIFDMADYCSLTNQFYNGQYHVANLAWFEGLSPELQELIQEVVKEAADKERQFLKEQEASWIQGCEDKGMTVVRTEEIDLASFQDAIKDMYDEYAKSIGGTYVQDLIAAASAAAQ